jgi:hypothetical protein
MYFSQVLINLHQCDVYVVFITELSICLHLVQGREQWQALVECGNEPSGSIKGGKFPDYTNDY